MAAGGVGRQRVVGRRCRHHLRRSRGRDGEVTRGRRQWHRERRLYGLVRERSVWEKGVNVVAIAVRLVLNEGLWLGLVVLRWKLRREKLVVEVFDWTQDTTPVHGRSGKATVLRQVDPK